MDDPEINSPANVDASVTYRDNRPEYDRLAKDTVTATKRDIPVGLTMPTVADLTVAPQKPVEDDDDFWNMSDEEVDFGGSDSDMDDFEDDDDDDDDK